MTAYALRETGREVLPERVRAKKKGTTSERRRKKKRAKPQAP